MKRAKTALLWLLLALMPAHSYASLLQPQCRSQTMQMTPAMPHQHHDGMAMAGMTMPESSASSSNHAAHAQPCTSQLCAQACAASAAGGSALLVHLPSLALSIVHESPAPIAAGFPRDSALQELLRPPTTLA